jgi:hypothetical protein
MECAGDIIPATAAALFLALRRIFPELLNVGVRGDGRSGVGSRLNERAFPPQFLRTSLGFLGRAAAEHIQSERCSAP